MKRKFDLLTLVLSSVTVVFFTVMFFVLPHKDFSQKENRTLSGVPFFTLEKLISGKYTSDLSGYINDQFPSRDSFVAVKAYSELAQGKLENNGIIYAQNDTLIAKDELTDSLLDSNLSAVKAFEDAVGIPVYLCVLPRSVDVFSEYLPDTYPTETNTNLWNSFYKKAQKLGIITPNLNEPLCKENNYYKTDHHYNSYGAYQTYKILAETLNYKPEKLDFFNEETVSTDFCGTSMRASGFYFAPRDSITLFRYDGDDLYNIIADGKKITLYDFSKLETTDKYAAFLGGNHARVDITSNTEKPKMLLIRDSFADSLAPFLAIHYDLTLIDVRYYTDSVQQLVIDEEFDCVAVLENMSEFAQNKNISYLRRPPQ